MKKLPVITLAAALVAAWSTTVLADPHWRGEGEHRWHGNDDGGLAETVRDSTRGFRDVSLAVAAGYGQFLGCVSGPDIGAMGVHFANGTLVGDDAVVAQQPEVLVYEPRANGELRLVAVEYLVLAEAWNASNASPPVLAGQTFHFTNSPNRYGLPPFYALHVWAWKHNPLGTFSNWNPKVACDEFTPDAS